MSRYAIIDGTSVINAAIYPDDEPPANPPPGYDDPVVAVQSDDACPGWTYNGDGTFSPPPQPTPQQLAQATYNTVMRSGLGVTSTSSVIPPTVFDLSTDQQSNLANVALYIAVNNRFPGGLSALPLQSVAKQAVSIPSTATWQAIATAIADYVALCDVALATALAGGTPSWPPANVTIA